MAYTTKAREYFRGVGATNDEIHGFFFIVANLKMLGKKPVMKYIDFRKTVATSTKTL